MKDGLLTLQQAAKQLGIKKKEVLSLIENNYIRAIIIDNTTFIIPSTIAALLNINIPAISGNSDDGISTSEEVESPLTKKDEATNPNENGEQPMIYKGSISALKDGRWMVQIDLGKDSITRKRKRYSKGCKTEDEAKEHLRKKLNELNGTLPSTPDNSITTVTANTNKKYTELTFEQYAINYLNSGGSGEASSMTLENYRRALRLLQKPLGNKPIAEITRQDLIKAFNKITSQYAKSMIDKAYSITKQILQTAYEDGDIPNDPTTKWKKPKSRKPKDTGEFEVFSDKDMEILLTKSKEYSNELHAQFALLACTGMRPGEMRALEWDSFDPIAKTVHIKQAATHEFEEITEITHQPKEKPIISVPKSKYSVRTLRLSDLAVDALLAWQEELKGFKNQAQANSKYIFPNKQGNFMTSGGCECFIKRFRKKYDLMDMRIHYYKFRHTMCTNLILAGQPIPVIQRIMGDDTIDVIMKIYTHVNNEKALEATADFYDKMNETNNKIIST